MIDTERNFILYLIQEIGLSAISSEFEQAVSQYDLQSEDADYYYEFRQFIGE